MGSKHRSRIAAGLAGGAAALVGTLAFATGAVADCDESFLRCDPAGQEQYAFPLENRILGASLPLRDDNGGKALEVYKQIVKRVGYEMPVKPRLGLYLLSVTVGNELQRPLVVSDYREGNLGLLVSHAGEEGFYSIGMPMNDLGAQSAGRRFGYPKYVAKMDLTDPSTFGSVPNQASHTASVKGRLTTSMQWTRDDKAPYPKELADVTLFRQPFFQRAEPHIGPDYWRTKLTALPLVPTKQASDGKFPEQEIGFDGVTRYTPTRGFTHVRLAPNVDDQDEESSAKFKLPDVFPAGTDLSDLVKLDQTVPGAYIHLQQTLYYQNKRFSRGEECLSPSAFDPLYGYPPGELNPRFREITQCKEGGPPKKLAGDEAATPPTGTPGSLGLPAARTCKSRRSFKIRARAPRGQKLRSARVFVNGKRVRTLRGKSLRAAVNLRGLPKGTVRVRIVARTTRGRTVTATRTYRTCAPKRAR